MTLDDLPEDALPVTYKTIFKHQQQDKKLLKEATVGNDYVIKSFHGAGKIKKLTTKQNKIVIPSTLQKRLVEWYHNQLCHPGKNRTEKTIGQHFTWKGM